MQHSHAYAHHSNSFPIIPERVQLWLHDLRTQPIGKQVEGLYRALRYYNRRSLDGDSRIKIAELLRDTVQLVCENLQRRYINLGLPLPGKSRQIFALHRALLIEMAESYKLAIIHSESKKLPLKIAHYPMAIERTFYYLGRVSLEVAQTYTALPDNLWDDLNGLYVVAEKHMIEHSMVHNDALETIKSRSVHQAYLQLALFELARPQTMRRGDAKLIYNRLEAWQEQAHIDQFDTSDIDRIQFLVDLNSDNPPMRASVYQAGKEAALRAIDLSPLLKYVHEELTQRSDKESPLPTIDHLPISALMCLQNNWGSSKKRDSQRTHQKSITQVEIGLKAICDLINQDLKITDSTASIPSIPTPSAQIEDEEPLSIVDEPDCGLRESRSSFITHPNFQEREQNNADIWQGVANRRLPQTTAQATAITKKQAKKKARGSEKWMILDQSEQGIGLARLGNSPSPACVGEIVALPIQGDEKKNWQFGVIRWMQFTAGDSFKCGIELLARNVIPVSTEYQLHQESKQLDCLLVAEQTASNHFSILTAPSFILDKNQVIHCEVNGKKQAYQLCTILDQTACYTRFEIKPMTSHEARMPTAPLDEPQYPIDLMDSTEEFKDIWGSL